MDNEVPRRPLAYTVEEAAALLRVSPSRIRTMVRSGALPQVGGLGRSIRVPSRALFELVGEQVPPIAQPLMPEPVVSEPSDPPRVSSDLLLEPRGVMVSPRRSRSRAASRDEKQAVGPIRAGDRRLWLLHDSAADRLMTWHIGDAETLCGRSPMGRWRRSERRWPRATMCPACLTATARLPDIDMASIPVGVVCMMRETRRGGAVTASKSGWHLGNGRTTSCGKRDGPWCLTEREPSPKLACFMCDERRRWERERIPGTIAAESAGRPAWSVLIDASVETDGVAQLIRQAPGLFAARRTDRMITPEDLERYGAGARELFDRGELLTTAAPSAPQFAPDLVVTSAVDPLVSATGWKTVLGPDGFVERMQPFVERSAKAFALRQRWDREARSATPSRTGARTQGR